MHYSYSDNIPEKTYETNKRRTVMSLSRGIIHHVAIQFPVGCAEVAHCHINRGLHQIWPTNPGGNYASDGYVIAFEDSYELVEQPLELELWTWNDSENHTHQVTVWLSILPKRSLIHYVFPEIINIFKKGKV